MKCESVSRAPRSGVKSRDTRLSTNFHGSSSASRKLGTPMSPNCKYREKPVKEQAYGEEDLCWD